MTIETRFRNRTAAGQLLANKLGQYADRSDVLVLGLPRGGVPVAFEVAKALNAPLDICVVRKLGAPGYQETAMGAIASDGVQVLNNNVLTWLRISEPTIKAVAMKELKELKRRDRVYRGDRPSPQISNRIIILVDDGLATGSTMRAAIASIKPQQPQRLIVASPVAPPATYQELSTEVDEVICLMTPKLFHAISHWYENFTQTTDAEVCELLATQEVSGHAHR